MLGMLANTAAIIVGGALGLLLKNGLQEKYKNILSNATALAVFFVGAAAAVEQMMKPQASPILFIVSLTVGGFVGEWVAIESKMESLGQWMQLKLQRGDNSPDIVQGFVSGTLVFCVGTMAILGAIESGVSGDNSILYDKSMLDGVIALVMATSLGAGVIVSAASLFVYEAVLLLLAGWISPFFTADMLREVSLVGGIIIAAIGLNLLKVTKMRVGNFLPAVLIPIIYYAVLLVFA